MKDQLDSYISERHLANSRGRVWAHACCRIVDEALGSLHLKPPIIDGIKAQLGPEATQTTRMPACMAMLIHLAAALPNQSSDVTALRCQCLQSRI